MTATSARIQGSGDELPKSGELAQEAINQAHDYRTAAMYTEWEVTYRKSREAVDLSRRMEETIKETEELFGSDADFDYRGLALHPEISGMGRDDLPSEHSVACLAAARILANASEADVRTLLIDMRALALARKQAEEKLQQGIGNIFTALGKTHLLEQAGNFTKQAAGELDVFPETATGCIEVCGNITERMDLQREEKTRAFEAIEERREREKEELRALAEKEAAPDARQRLLKIIDAL